MIQDEVQGYHWTSDYYCTVHPVIINMCVDQEKIVSSHCVISDDLNHDVCIVYTIQETLLQFLKENFPNIIDVHYYILHYYILQCWILYQFWAMHNNK